MTKHYTTFEWELQFENDSESENLHLCLPDETLSKMDAAMQSMFIRTREDFAIAAILYALRSLDDDENAVMMGLADNT